MLLVFCLYIIACINILYAIRMLYMCVLYYMLSANRNSRWFRLIGPRIEKAPGALQLRSNREAKL